MQLKSKAKIVDGARSAAGRLAGRISGLVRSAPAGGLRDGPTDGALKGLGLSAKLLLLTSMFVMLAEVLIFVPSVANFRVNWLLDRLTASRLAALAADAAPQHNLPPVVRLELLSTAMVHSVSIKQNGVRRMVLPPSGPISIDETFDLRPNQKAMMAQRMLASVGLIVDALAVFVRGQERTIRVLGHPFTAPGQGFLAGDFVEIVLPEAPLRNAMLSYGLNILGLSIIISMIAAALVYFALNKLLVQPMMRITHNMLAFSRDPENASLIINPSRRTDEVGTAERELAHMQNELRSLLNQKNHLAALGLAVSKINHDLRNMLASAQLLSDRLGMVKDPTVQSFAPKLIASLDRAINFCNDTLRYGKAEEAAPRRDVFRFADLVEEVADGLGLPRPGVGLEVEIADGLIMDADRDHIYRVLNNLMRNSMQALEQQASGEGVMTIGASREGRRVICIVRDNGPGVPEKARANLFRAFQGGARKGGAGLGLAIAAELVQAHGGRLALQDTGPGATFSFDIPDRSVQS